MPRERLMTIKAKDNLLEEQSSVIQELKQNNHLLEAKQEAASERTDFVEELIAEMAMMLYQ